MWVMLLFEALSESISESETELSPRKLYLTKGIMHF